MNLKNVRTVNELQLSQKFVSDMHLCESEQLRRTPIPDYGEAQQHIILQKCVEGSWSQYAAVKMRLEQKM